MLIPFLEPFFIRLLIHLILIFLGEAVPKLLTYWGELLVPFSMVKFETFVKFSIANRTEVARMCVSLVFIIQAFHKALIPSTVPHSKHMAELMGCYFDNALENHRLPHFLIFKIVISHIRSKPSNALDSAIGWDSIAKAIITQVFCEKVNISKWQNPNASWLPRLKWRNYLFQNSDSIILSFAEVILLSADILFLKLTR